MMEFAIPILAAATGTHEAQSSPLAIEPLMMGLTWLTFVIAAIVLHKVAWKPILTTLEKREESIRQSVENAAVIRGEMAKLEETRKKMLDEAETKSQDLVDKAKRAATELSKTLQAKAEEDARLIGENARKDIQRERDQAILALRRESADLAVQIARKILHDQLDEARGRKLADTLIEKA